MKKLHGTKSLSVIWSSNLSCTFHIDLVSNKIPNNMVTNYYFTSESS